MPEISSKEFENLTKSMLVGGHKVFSTYHAKDVKGTFEKIRDYLNVDNEVNDEHIKSEDIFMETLDRMEENGK